MKKISMFIVASIAALFCANTLAWNAAGHEIVAQIAYDRLLPSARKKIDQLTKAMSHNYYADDRFLRIATWPDRVKSKTRKYNAWHYIDLPVMRDGLKPVKISPINAVWAVQNAKKILMSKQARFSVRAKYLSFLVHIIGDIHQPMHCITEYSQQFPPPEGDQGGNLVVIHSPLAKNLHGLWDMGLGLLHSRKTGSFFNYYRVVRTAHSWSNQYPPGFFGARYSQLSPQEWAKTSHHLALEYAYDLPSSLVPSSSYIQQGKRVVKEQVVIAGYQLAEILNQIFG